MSDTLVRTDPVAGQAHVAPSASIRFAEPCQRYSVRSRDAALLGRFLGEVPTAIGETVAGVARLGPDELLVLCPPASPLAIPGDVPVSIVDVSERSVGIIVEGPRAIDILSAGCPLDLERFAVGRATRTIYETVEIVILRETSDRFRVEVWRSFAPWLWLSFCTVADEA